MNLVYRDFEDSVDTGIKMTARLIDEFDRYVNFIEKKK